jgi:hypothetical protein
MTPQFLPKLKFYASSQSVTGSEYAFCVRTPWKYRSDLDSLPIIFTGCLKNLFSGGISQRRSKGWGKRYFSESGSDQLYTVPSAKVISPVP